MAVAGNEMPCLAACCRGEEDCESPARRYSRGGVHGGFAGGSSAGAGPGMAAAETENQSQFSRLPTGVNSSHNPMAEFPLLHPRGGWPLRRWSRLGPSLFRLAAQRTALLTSGRIGLSGAVREVLVVTRFIGSGCGEAAFDWLRTA